MRQLSGSASASVASAGADVSAAVAALSAAGAAAVFPHAVSAGRISAKRTHKSFFMDDPPKKFSCVHFIMAAPRVQVSALYTALSFTRKVISSPLSERAVMLPLCASAMARAIESPIPLPPVPELRDSSGL